MRASLHLLAHLKALAGGCVQDADQTVSRLTGIRKPLPHNNTGLPRKSHRMLGYVGCLAPVDLTNSVLRVENCWDSFVASEVMWMLYETLGLHEHENDLRESAE
ncbi:hypothetical protein E2C01_012917 [Portunus trituberculatus]|uniref:Uncharacterized protein n=1 Tax=Portunus trituberculatus TaxID=210409 RepID=A0A5B7DFJ9_PORTR|nr:hypothetical protein [Portunus trituberculatus]